MHVAVELKKKKVTVKEYDGRYCQYLVVKFIYAMIITTCGQLFCP